jgi:hypothetical protein
VREMRDEKKNVIICNNDLLDEYGSVYLDIDQ